MASPLRPKLNTYAAAKGSKPLARERYALFQDEDDDDQGAPSWSRLFDIRDIEAILQSQAASGKAISYSVLLDALGMKFSRPKMRSLCVALGEVDRRAALNGEPELAVLVVRASDGLPGAGWWSVNRDEGYQGPWEGAQAMDYIQTRQSGAFAYWRVRNGDKA